MSYYHDEEDPHAFEPRPNCTCPDCGERWHRSEHDTCVWCGPCAQRRDAAATAQDLKAMAKAVLRLDLMNVKEIA